MIGFWFFFFNVIVCWTFVLDINQAKFKIFCLRFVYLIENIVYIFRKYIVLIVKRIFLSDDIRVGIEIDVYCLFVVQFFFCFVNVGGIGLGCEVLYFFLVINRNIGKFRK